MLKERLIFDFQMEKVFQSIWLKMICGDILMKIIHHIKMFYPLCGLPCGTEIINMQC
jgi:hypothetical protein